MLVLACFVRGANDSTAESKNEKFMRFDVGDDADEGDFGGDEGEAGAEEDGESMEV